MDFQTDAIVIGAGVVGLAIGRALALAGLETVIVERGHHFGEETSSRNSEVIHAGIYYPPGSLKAQTCVRGKALLYDFVESHKVPYWRCGKLVVASDAAEAGRLDAIRDRAAQCGVDDLALLDASALADLEPAVTGAKALFSPSTGIVDSHQLMLALLGDFEGAGGMLALGSPLESGRLSSGGLHRLRIGGEMPAEMGARMVVNAAGLYARDIWQRLGGADMHSKSPPQFYARGRYYTYPGSAPFSHLIYPLPQAGGLGVHATLDMGGQVRFGPDVAWVDDIDYHFDESAADEFLAAISAYFPAVESSRLQPGYTGIRPKIVGPGEAAGDFAILDATYHGVPGFCSLHGIESPGLTACLAIAENVVSALTDSENNKKPAVDELSA